VLLLVPWVFLLASSSNGVYCNNGRYDYISCRIFLILSFFRPGCVLWEETFPSIYCPRFIYTDYEGTGYVYTSYWEAIRPKNQSSGSLHRGDIVGRISF
jgi:hypothetical protein